MEHSSENPELPPAFESPSADKRRRMENAGHQEGATTDFQIIQSSDREKTQAELAAQGAVMEFSEEGKRLVPTAEQLALVKQDWTHYVDSMAAQYHNMPTAKLEEVIKELEKPNRKRPGAFHTMYKQEPEKTLEWEQLDRAALKEVLAMRRRSELSAAQG